MNWTKHIPKTEMAGIKTIYPWLWYDSEELFDKNQPKDWTKDSISYHFNDYGYRSDEFIKNAKNYSILSIGCSTSFGFALPYEMSWPSLCCNSIEDIVQKPVKNFNLSYPGKSNDYISRVLFNAVEILNPDLILIQFTRISRREYINDNGEIVHYLPTRGKQGLTDNEYKSFVTLSNDYSDFYNFSKNYFFIEQFLNSLKINYLFCDWPLPYQFKELSRSKMNYTESKQYVGHIEHLDFARDQAHIGVKSHKTLSQKFLKCAKTII